MSSVLRDLAVDIINAAKASKDAKTKVFQLEQIKEIVMHRQRDLLPALITDVFDFMLDKSAVVRKFLIRLATDLFLQDAVVVLPKLLELYQFLLTDSNDGVLTTMVRELSKIYNKVVLSIAAIPELNAQEAASWWNSTKGIVSKFHDHLASARSDSLKQACIRLIEEQILFAIPSMTTNADPRLARKDPRLNRTVQKDATVASSNANTAESISLHHLIVSRNALQRDAEEIMSKLTSWVVKGGPPNYPLSPNLFANVAQMLASVGTLRPTYGLTAAKVLTQFITEKSSIISLVETVELENMARAATRLLRATAVYAVDPEGQMHKLKAAVNSLNITASEQDISVVGKKRDVSEISEEDDLGLNDEQYRTTVISALDSAEAARKEQLERATAAAHSLFQSKSAVAESNTFDVVMGDFTELSSDILSIETSALKFSTVLVSIDQMSSVGGDDLVCCPISPSDGREYNDLCIFSLLKLLDSYVQMLSSGDLAMAQYKEIITRTVLSMVISSIDNESNTYVRIITAWSTSVEKSQTDGIQTVAPISRGLWLFVSFALQICVGLESVGVKPETDIELKIDFLTKLCNDIYDCCERNADNEIGCKALSSIHESTILAILSRMLQIPHLRTYCKQFLVDLQKIPHSCVRLLKLLVTTGTKGSSSGRDSSGYRGTRAEALSLIAELVFVEDIEIATECLHYLLWNTLDDSFELCSRTIEVILKVILPANDWCNESIYCFAIQAIATSVGKDLSISFNNSTMDVEGDAVLTLSNAMSTENYDNGARFNGSFDSVFHQSLRENFQKAAHFFNKLCLCEFSLLPIFVELHACVSIAESIKVEGVDQGSTVADSLLGLLKEAVKPMIPAMLRSHKDTDIFELISRVNEARSRPLVAYILNLLQSDFSQPAKSGLIEKVYKYIGGKIEQDDSQSMDVDQTTAISVIAALPIASIELDEDFKLFIPLISGLTANVIEQCLPRMIRLFSEDLSGLEIVFSRIIKARPPPMTKANLFVALHRINIEQHDLKTKTLTQSIAICLNNHSDFSSAVVKDALHTLMNDEIPHMLMMRSAILCANSFPDVKKFVLVELIPTLIQRSVWSTAPKVWEGVMVGADNLTSGTSNSKFNEPTLKGLLGIPGSILKSVLKVTKNLKKVMAKYLQSLPSQEREEVLNGKKSLEVVSGTEVQDVDKKKIAKELLAFVVDAPPVPAK